MFEQYRKMRKEIEANPKIREKSNWFRDISASVLASGQGLSSGADVRTPSRPSPRCPCSVHVVRIGDLAIATFPLAPYLDFGIQIKARSKAVQTFTVQTADGHFRYLPTQRSQAGSAYGAVPESTVFGPKGGRELVEQTLELIESLWTSSR